METPPDDCRASNPRYFKENFDANQQILDKVQELSVKYGCSASQLSLAWLFHKGKELGVSVIPIPGTTKLQNATSNFGAVKISLSDYDCRALESIADQVAGERENESYLSITI
jgi:aryl-alcohol dehydrogenase-like predicted oxidoreductase